MKVPIDGEDILAITVVVALVILKIRTGDSSLDIPVTIIIGYYFGKRGEIHRQTATAANAASASDEATRGVEQSNS